MRGYIALEGVNGVGKSSIIEELKNRNLRVHFTREIGGCPGAEKIRDFLTKNEWLSPQGKEALIWSARTQLARFLAQNHGQSKVVSDRCWVSTYVYNAVSLESTLERVELLRRSYPTPDVYVLLDASVEAICERQRMRLRSRVSTPFDKKETDELAEAVRLYRNLFSSPPQSVPGKWIVIDANQKFDKVVGEIINVIMDMKQ